MTQNDKQQFHDMLAGALDVYGVQPSAAAMSIWWAALERYDMADVRRALSDYIQDPAGGRFPPKPADLIGRMQAHDGWLGAEEAWAIVSPTLTDESITVFWTQPMQEAFGVALTLADDPVAARMAFKEVYTRKVQEWRQLGAAPKWQMSPGTDRLMRDGAIQEAVRLGRLPAENAMALLSHQHEPPEWLQALTDNLTHKEPPKLTVKLGQDDGEREVAA